ncbi:hypothetical protein WJX72_000672 [[Myrmecia] bisecta]|uniref:Uncharacterized protein n=1 Tax=[Myrmecia] bisecta TaxID=41462 RepID=A0AAW1QP12_9CHLO
MSCHIGCNWGAVAHGGRLLVGDSLNLQYPTDAVVEGPVTFAAPEGINSRCKLTLRLSPDQPVLRHVAIQSSARMCEVYCQRLGETSASYVGTMRGEPVEAPEESALPSVRLNSVDVPLQGPAFAHAVEVTLNMLSLQDRASWTLQSLILTPVDAAQAPSVLRQQTSMERGAPSADGDADGAAGGDAASLPGNGALMSQADEIRGMLANLMAAGRPPSLIGNIPGMPPGMSAMLGRAGSHPSEAAASKDPRRAFMGAVARAVLAKQDTSNNAAPSRAMSPDAEQDGAVQPASAADIARLHRRLDSLEDTCGRLESMLQAALGALPASTPHLDIT